MLADGSEIKDISGRPPSRLRLLPVPAPCSAASAYESLSGGHARTPTETETEYYRVPILRLVVGLLPVWISFRRLLLLLWKTDVC